MLQLCRYFEPGSGARFGALREGRVYDLTSTGQPAYSSLSAWLKSVDLVGLNEVIRQLFFDVDSLSPAGEWDKLQKTPDSSVVYLLPPIDRQEVWAAGVTYLRSREAREEESERSGIYDRVYDADRPELFFKATPHRVVGPNDMVAIRGDSKWDVPEPEVTVVLTPDLQIVGYTAGNDISSRDIEGANPLYLPQAKLFSRCCALGPAITLAPDFETGQAAAIGLAIHRQQKIAFSGQTSTAEMKRTIPELVSYLGRYNTFPDGAFLMTGTGLVPPDEFTLEPGDEVEITIERIGRLVNGVTREAG